MIAWTYSMAAAILLSSLQDVPSGETTMKNNIRLTALFAVIAVLVAGAGIDAQPSVDAPATADAATTWSAAFPVAQAGFAPHAAAAER